MVEKLSIRAVAKIAGLSEHSLRAWEKRYNAFQPKRDSSGRRVYTLSEVEKLKFLVILTNRGHRIKDIANLTTVELRRLMEKSADHSQGRQTKFLPDFSAATYVQYLTELCEKFDLPSLIAATKRAQHQFDTRTYLLNVILPLLQVIGRKVATGEMDVYQEHSLSAVIRYQLSSILYSIDNQVGLDLNQGCITFAAPEGDHHDLGVLVAAVLALLNGFRVLYLGANTPALSVARAAVASDSRMIVVGTVAPHSSLSTKALREFFTELRDSLDEETKICVGGWRLEELASVRAKDPNLNFFNDLHQFERSLHAWKPSVALRPFER